MGCSAVVEPPGKAHGVSGTGGFGNATGGTGNVTIAPPDEWLSDEGLRHADGSIDAAALPYTPRFPAWNDGATQRRWISLPADGAIDTTDPDRWKFPVGTRLWEEFRLAGRPMETRELHKEASNVWTMKTFLWLEDGSDAKRVQSGAKDVLGTTWDVPSESQCRSCHGQIPDRVAGFSALQLAHDAAGPAVAQLVADRRLEAAALVVPSLPGDANTVAALGYLHGNCAVCHNPWTTLPYRTLDLFLRLEDLGSVETTAAWQAVGTASPSRPNLLVPELLIRAGDPDASAVYYRMHSRESAVKMPPAGSEVVDEAGSAAVRAWIESLGN